MGEEEEKEVEEDKEEEFVVSALLEHRNKYFSGVGFCRRSVLNKTLKGSALP